MSEKTKKVIELIANDKKKTLHEVINQSGIMNEFPLDETPALINSVAYIKEKVPEHILEKIKGVLS